MNYKNRITGQQVTAIQWNDDTDNKDIEVFCGYWASIREEKFGGIWVTTQVGNTIQRNLKSGRWVVKHSEGMFEVLENEEFTTKYRRVLTEEEGSLVCQFGVYGTWILKHGKYLPDCALANKVRETYGDYLHHPGPASSLVVFDAIDAFVKGTGWEKVFEDYEMSLNDLLW